LTQRPPSAERTVKDFLTLMSTHLHHLIAQQEIADLIRAAERARVTQGSRPIEPASRRGGLIARFLVPRRLRVAEIVAAAAGCADDRLP
jgi:hypothetical protein